MGKYIPRFLALVLSRIPAVEIMISKSMGRDTIYFIKLFNPTKYLIHLIAFLVRAYVYFVSVKIEDITLYAHILSPNIDSSW